MQILWSASGWGEIVLGGALNLTCHQHCVEMGDGNLCSCPAWTDSSSSWWTLSDVYWRSPKMRSCRSETGKLMPVMNQSMHCHRVQTQQWFPLMTITECAVLGFLWAGRKAGLDCQWQFQYAIAPIAIISTTHATGALQWIPAIIQDTPNPTVII